MRNKLEHPILSIVIPTKNRYEYLKILVEALILSPNRDFEIIIQDNSDDNTHFLSFLNGIEDERVRYFYSKSWRSVCDNCDEGVSNSLGQYVTMIGDDDGVLVEQTIQFCYWMNERSVEAAVVNAISYVWPDVVHSVWGSASTGRLEKRDFSQKITPIDVQKELQKVLSKGGGQSLENLPRLYQSIISKKALNVLKAKTGTCFPGPSPDMSNAVGLSSIIKTAVLIDFPLVVSGHGAKSTGGQGQRKEHHGEIAAQNFLPSDTIEKWGTRVPFFWSGNTIWAESARRALLAIGKQKTAEQDLNYAYLYASCLIYETHSDRVWKSIYSTPDGFDKAILLIKIFYFLPVIFAKRLIGFVKNIINKKINPENTSEEYIDIKQVLDTLNNFQLKL